MLLTLVNVEERLAEFAGEDGFGQVSEVLLDHVGDVEGRLTLVRKSIWVRLHHLTEQLDPRLQPRLPEETQLRDRKKISESLI